MSADPLAFQQTLEREFEMAPEEARELADVVLERFSTGDEVDDATLDAEVRSVFYTLEAKKMLSFRRVEYTREDGDKRRAFFWKLRPEAVAPSVSIPVQDMDVDVYSTLPPTAWRHAG